MKTRHRLFKRHGKQWLPSFLVSPPSQVKACLMEWADASNYPTQEEISRAIAKAENILLRTECIDFNDMTDDFVESLILLLSALRAFMEHHNASDAIRDLLVSCARAALLLTDPFSLDDSFQKLRENAEKDSWTAFDTQGATEKKDDVSEKKVNELDTPLTTDAEGEAKTRRFRRSVREATNVFKKKMTDKLSQKKKLNKSMWSIVNDPELKLMYEEIMSILKHLTEETVSGCMATGAYAFEPLKALKHKRSSAYGGISSALESALKKPQASTLKQIAMAAIEVPADIIIGAGCGTHVGYLESRSRLNSIRDIIASNQSDNRNMDMDQGETYSIINKPAMEAIMSVRARIRRTKSLSDIGKRISNSLTQSNMMHVCKNAYYNTFKSDATHKKDGYMSKNETDSVVRVRLRRSYSYSNAKLEEKKEAVSSQGQRLLDEWFIKDNYDEEEPEQNTTMDRNDSIHSSDDDFSFKDSIMRLKEIGNRTKVASSIKSTLLRKGNVEYMKGNVRDILDVNMKKKIIELIRKLEDDSCNMAVGIISHILSSYSHRSGLDDERKKIISCTKRILQTLTSQENIDLLASDLEKISKIPPYTTLKLLLSLRRDTSSSTGGHAKETSAAPRISNTETVETASDTRKTGGERHDEGNADGDASNAEDSNFNHFSKTSYVEQLYASIVDIIESPEGRNVIADVVDIYMSIKLEPSRQRLSKAIKLFKLISKHYRNSMPSYIIAYLIIKDISSKVLPFFARESNMLSIPIYKPVDIKGFELHFLKEPSISIRDFTPDKLSVSLDHRVTSPEEIQRIVHLEKDKHAGVPDPIRNFVKFFLKLSPSSVDRFQKWDIREGETGPKWFISVVLKGIHFVLESDEVALMATSGHKGTPGNIVYNVIRTCNKIGGRKRKEVPGRRKNEVLKETARMMEYSRTNTGHGYSLADGEKAKPFNKKSYTVWKGSVEGMVYGKGITVNLTFETVPQNEDMLSEAGPLVKKLHRRLSHSKAIVSGDVIKLKHMNPPKGTGSNKRKSIGASGGADRESKGRGFSSVKERISRAILYSDADGESFRLAGVAVSVPYFSSRLRVRGIMGPILSIVAERKLRVLIKESIEDHIVKSLSAFNFERVKNIA